ncbi:hypothetical protein CMV30_07145 [Nibricoccus aquaticus]|uniref:Uncharacterized protein n=2 Tax=Nibricoccus aquaticus TaxID=2576891 RepID=A0A290Q5G9_9BACT|nr:hypothetical protein CMV30_07145 [Nibricoccus aquaticus]
MVAGFAVTFFWREIWSTNQTPSKDAGVLFAQASTALAVGDSEAAILEFFNKQKWDYHYYAPENRYGSMHTVKTKNGVWLHKVYVGIELDSKKCVERIYVEDSYAGVQ